ncbi:putative Zinc metalloproteinase nas-4 [Hypsibius exemplaris]|uniref:Metalloendopeptidase n=1 Tax=Hypsibius exemplaris TaxID=2072580 RepID=A0A9X6N8V9_HYPEX|nr:putative Zinc metalloproteinase nas-4 [Hypsibius exemplaris]
MLAWDSPGTVTLLLLIVGIIDHNTSAPVDSINANDSAWEASHPEQDQHLSEGDILDLDLPALIQAARSDLFSDSSERPSRRRKRNAVVFSYFRWADGVIPFTMDILYNKTERMHILTAMNEFHGKTCIRFTPRNFHKDFLSIIKHRGCASKIGRQGGRQPLFLNQECIDPKRPGIVMHELMHSLGFLHEQTRHDRDDFIDVLWSNIAPDHQDNFAKVDQRLVGIYDAPYDYGSVMHYGPNFFAVNYTNPTIIPKKPTNVLGQRTRLSDADAMKINKLYHCENYEQDKVPVTDDVWTLQ